MTDAHGGALRLLDRPGGGLIVRLELPRATTPAASQPSATRAGVLLPMLFAGLLTLLLSPPVLAVEPVVYPAPMGEQQVLLIDAATDRTLMEPLNSSISRRSLPV